MKERAGWLPAVLLVLTANLLPLLGWWWNRTGAPVMEAELTEREAAVVRGGDENSSVRLQLRPMLEGPSREGWVDSASLAGLGFESERLQTGPDITVSPRRPNRRHAWVLLRLDPRGAVPEDSAFPITDTRLRPIAVGPDPAELRRRSGGRGNELVLRAVVRVNRVPLPADSVTGVSPGTTWQASLDRISPWTLHVPRSLVPVLDRLAPDRPRPGTTTGYLARITIGRFQLPRVAAILPDVRSEQ